jgi:exonuclease SbcC
MIPLKLSISGFLSYREHVELDFTGFDLACISGPNGAGKSSLLDAITWALFGQARKRDDSLINSHPDVKAAEVTFTFAYEGNVYRAQRANPRGKTSLLEFYIQVPPSNGKSTNSPDWKPLTERTLRETQARIESTLRMDYDTFVNASFFLQGKADQFTQQRPGDRKRILGSILGLEIWEVYRQRSADRRKAIEVDIVNLDGRLAEINAELGEEKSRKARLKELQAELERLARSRAAQESALENYRKIAATLAEQRKLVETLARQLDAARRRHAELEARLEARGKEKESFAQVISRSPEIEAAYAAWQQARYDVEYWDEIAARFREQEKRRQAPLDEINAARARLNQELDTLQKQGTALQEQLAEVDALKAKLETAQSAVSEAEAQLARRAQFDAELQEARQRQADARAENPRLKTDMDDLKERIDQLQEVEGAVCPLCGQPLSPQDRERLIGELTVQGTEMGDKYRANQALMRETDRVVGDLEKQIGALSQAETALRDQTRLVDQLTTRLEGLRKSQTEWEHKGAPHLAEVADELQGEKFSPEARARLAEIDAELKTIGYDAAAHDAARQAENQGRDSEAGLRSLEKARAALEPLEREISELQDQSSSLRTEVERQQDDHDNAAAALAAAEAQAPDLQAAERELLSLQEQENRLRMEVGAARQKVEVLDDLKTRRKAFDAQREEFTHQVMQYKQLERAFGKDGVPALLIEQALPQIEERANEILDRLSGGTMSVRFITQAAYKDKRRDDLKETLDIQISDGAGTRDYEMFSGGEAFRVNFAIRLALSEVLAQRAGARLQTLVIDEGFGSQDAQGRQRLIEAINLVRPDFAKILVITHIDELKDAFPTRIEVEKTSHGSELHVL